MSNLTDAMRNGLNVIGMKVVCVGAFRVAGFSFLLPRKYLTDGEIYTITSVFNREYINVEELEHYSPLHSARFKIMNRKEVILAKMRAAL
jgi:hypothetical protein